MRIGYIGLGNMGGALARRLQQSRQLLAYDQDEAALNRQAEAGSIPCATIGEIAARSDMILFCLPTSDHVRAVLFGAAGIAVAARPGTLIVDQTTGDPNATRAMAAELAGTGVELIDAPVSGGVRGATAGTIAIMVGASPEQYERVSPVLSAISPNVFHAGGVGAGHTIKLVNNLLSCAQRLLSCEAMALAVKNGVEPQTAVDILLAGGGRNAYLEKVMGPDIINGKLRAAFTLGLAHKDVRLACQLGIDSGIPMFFGNLTREMYQMGISDMGHDAKVDSVALMLDRLAGTHVVPETETTHD
jgi:3-hydroxyisobutyrate dehydrogenase